MTSDEEFGERLRERLEDLAGSAPPPAPPAALAPASPSWNRSRLIAAAAAVVLIAGAIAAYSRSSSPSRVQISEPTTTTTTAHSDSTTTETTDTTPSTSEPASTVPATVLSTTTTSASPPADCTPDDLEATVASDKPAFAVGETVTITVSIRNRSDHACEIQSQQRYPNSWGAPVKITDPNGEPIWHPGGRGAGVRPFYDPITLAPGDSYEWTTVQWDQHFCQGPCAQDYAGSQGEGAQVPPGSYRALPADDSPPPASTVTPASFELTP